MNFYIQQAAPPIRPAGQTGAPTSSGFVQFLILGGLLVGGYYAYEALSTPAAPASRYRKTSDAEFAALTTDWAREAKEEKVANRSKQKSAGFRKLASYLKRLYPGATIEAEGDAPFNLDARGIFGKIDLQRMAKLEQAGRKFGFGLKEVGPTELFFEAH